MAQHWKRRPNDLYPGVRFEDEFQCPQCCGWYTYWHFRLGDISFPDGVQEDMEAAAVHLQGPWLCHNCLWHSQCRRCGLEMSSGRSKKDPDMFRCFLCKREAHWKQYRWMPGFSIDSAHGLEQVIEEGGHRWCCCECFKSNAVARL